MNPWKPCDIRGLHPIEVSPELLRLVGHGVASQVPPGSAILIAGDFRPSTPILKEALTEGLVESGARVLDAGEIPTPIAYFAFHQLRLYGVMIVTASHNPAAHNGLKLMLGSLPPGPEDFDRLRQRVAEGKFREAKGSYEKVQPISDYKDWILRRWKHLAQAKPMQVVLDAGNGAWSEIAPAVFEALGFRVHRLFCEIDGTFPNRIPDCARLSALSALQTQVRNTRASLGVAWDGDGDRVAFVDETGSAVSADEVSLLLLRHLMPARTGAKVVLDIKLSDKVRCAVLECGDHPLVERSGHSFIKRRMIQENCRLGCELSGHYFYDELHGGDDGLFSALLLAEVIGGTAPLGSLRKQLGPFFLTPDLRLPLNILPYDEIIRRLHDQLKVENEVRIDGLKVETAQGFVLARRSVTEAVVTMRLEGRTKESLQELLETCRKAYPEFSREFSAQIHSVKSS